jgi:hypothetical protein
MGLCMSDTVCSGAPPVLPDCHEYVSFYYIVRFEKRLVYIKDKEP